MPGAAKKDRVLVKAEAGLSRRVVEIEQVVRPAGVFIDISDALFGNTGW